MIQTMVAVALHTSDIWHLLFNYW